MRGKIQAIVIFTIILMTGWCALSATTAPVYGQVAETGRVNHNANLRAGPGTNYKIIGSARQGETVTISGTNATGTWLHLQTNQWIAAFLVDRLSADGATPVVEPAAPAAALATATPSATPAASNAAPGRGFAVVERRLWDVYENGGSLDGPSVHCGDRRNLFVHVFDENGRRLNGVAVQAQYGAREIIVTGSQGEGDGVAEFVLGSGQEVKVIRDETGQPVASEAATGLSTNPQNIDHPSLIAAGYCQDGETCRAFGDGLGCIGHFSWTVKFQRR
jgi:hypothetical protein